MLTLKRVLSSVAVVTLAAALHASAQEKVELDMISKIRYEGFRNSKIMEIASGLMDDIGPRLTGSPNVKRANEWTRDKLAEVGLANAHIEEGGPVGRGWAYESCSLRLVSPDVAQLIAVPRAWTPATNGAVRGKVVQAKIDSKEDIEKLKGKLAGKFLLLGDPREFKPHEKADFERYDEKTLQELSQYELPGTPRFTREAAMKRRQLSLDTLKLLAEEKPLGVIVPGGSDFGTIHVQGAGNQRPNEQYPVPSVTVSDEQYARIVRLAEHKKDPELELDVKATYYDNPQQYNTIAEIPGTAKNG